MRRERIISHSVDDNQSLRRHAVYPLLDKSLQYVEVGGRGDLHRPIAARQPISKHSDRRIQKHKEVRLWLQRAYQAIEPLAQGKLRFTQVTDGMEATREDKKILIQSTINEADARLSTDRLLLFGAQQQVIDLIGQRVVAPTPGAQLVGQRLLEWAFDMLFQPGHKRSRRGKSLDQCRLTGCGVANHGDELTHVVSAVHFLLHDSVR